MKEVSPRLLRVAEEVRHTLSSVFQRDVLRDPVLAQTAITVMEVRMTPDLKIAKVYIACHGQTGSGLMASDQISEVLAALGRVRPFLRRELAKTLAVKFTPDFRFLPDTALDYAMKVQELLDHPTVKQDLALKEQNSLPNNDQE